MVYKLKHRETKHKNGYLFVRIVSKSPLVSSSSDSEDGNESEINVQANTPKKHCSVLLLNHLPSQDLESGDTTNSEKKLFPS